MNKLKVITVFLLTIGLFVATADAAINVVTTEGEEADLALSYSSTDLIQGMIATELDGDLGWHDANTDADDKLPAFTDGSGALSGVTGLLNDFPGAGNPAKRIQYDFAAGVDIGEIDVFSGNGGGDGRIFHTYTVSFSWDNAVSWSDPIYVQSHLSGTVNNAGNNAFHAVLSQLTDTSGTLGVGVTNLQFDFYAVDNTGGEMRDPFEGVNPFTGVDDGFDVPIASSLIWEIDVHGPSSAYGPIPAQDAPNVLSSQSTLSWKNPEGANICEVYYGKNAGEPNALSYKTMLTLIKTIENPAAESSVAIPGNLVEGDICYWVVDCSDVVVPSGEPNLPGFIWAFTVNDNDTPVVGAGDDQGVWLGMDGVAGEVTVDLKGSVFDDGLPNPPGETEIKWTLVSGPETVIDANDMEVAWTTLTETGTYEFELWASDSEFEADDSVMVYVGNDSCETSHMMPDAPDYPIYDFNKDCIVDMKDFAEFAAAWLDCTDTLTDCL